MPASTVLGYCLWLSLSRSTTGQDVFLSAKLVDAPPAVPGLGPLYWLDDRLGNATYSAGVLTLAAGSETDWFIDPNTTKPTASAPALLFDPPAGDWQLSATVKVQHESQFDAGVLFVHQGPEDYAKFCFELSPEKESTVVAAVTRGVSDDTNSIAIQNDAITYRVSKFNNVFAFHYRRLGESYWRMMRLFQLRDPAAPTAAGFISQSPTGEGHVTHFSEITFAQTTLKNARDGS